MANGTITTGGTAQTLLAAKPHRNFLIIHATTEDMWVKPDGTAAADDGYIVKTNTPFVRDCAQFPIWRNAISIVSATTGAKFQVEES